jgi:hypothetical protein
MYSSSLIGRQWAEAIRAIDGNLAREVDANGLDHMTDIDELLESRRRLSDALLHSGETPTAEPGE